LEVGHRANVHEEARADAGRRFHRGMTRPFFSRERISHFDIFNRHVDNAIAQAKNRLKEGYPIDLQVGICTIFTMQRY
jgi:hypothetical protein